MAIQHNEAAFRLSKLLRDSFTPKALKAALSNEEFWEEVPELIGIAKGEWFDAVVEASRQYGSLRQAAFWDALTKRRSKRKVEFCELKMLFINRADVQATNDLGESVDTFGDPDVMQLILKAASEDFVKSTKAMEVPGGCVLQVTTREMRNGTVSVAEAIPFIPGVRVHTEHNDDGTPKARRLVADSPKQTSMNDS